MDANTLIQAELTRIENEAARQSSQLLGAQDRFVAAHVLVDLLKAHGAEEGLHVSPIYHWGIDASFLIYPQGDSAQTVAAIERAGLTIEQVCQGFSDATTRIVLHGYANVEVYVKRSELEWQVAA